MGPINLLLASAGYIYFFFPVLSFFETQPSWVAVAPRVPAESCRVVLRNWGLCWMPGDPEVSGQMLSLYNRKGEDMKSHYLWCLANLLWGSLEGMRWWLQRLLFHELNQGGRKLPSNWFVVESSKWVSTSSCPFLAKKKNVHPFKW